MGKLWHYRTFAFVLSFGLHTQTKRRVQADREARAAAVQEAAELLFEECGESAGIGAGGGGEKRLHVLAHHLMEDGAFGLVTSRPRV